MQDKTRDIIAWKKFRGSRVWKMILEKLDKRIEELDREIELVGNNEIKYSSRDISVIEKKDLKILKNLPDNMLADLLEQAESGLNENADDPYED